MFGRIRIGLESVSVFIRRQIYRDPFRTHYGRRQNHIREQPDYGEEIPKLVQV